MAVSIVFKNNRELILDNNNYSTVELNFLNSVKKGEKFMRLRGRNLINIDDVSWIREVKAAK